MVNAPNFAQTSDKGDMRTFAMGFPPDPRAINWHVDRYARNFYFKQYYNVGAFPYAVERSFPIHVLRHSEPAGWPDRAMMEEAWEDERLALSYMGFVQSNCYSLARKWFTNLKGDEWMRDEFGPQQTICPNLSLTRYDWQPNAVPKYYSMGRTPASHSVPTSKYFQYGNEVPRPLSRLANLMAVSLDDIYSCRFEPDYLTKNKCGKSFHGPSYEFWDWKKSN